jgi:hypothetical protein
MKTTVGASRRRTSAVFLSASLIAAVLSGSGVCYATSIYVSPTGSPTGQGTIADPMTFEAGLTKAHDDTTVTEVVLRGGTYNVVGRAGSIDPVPSGPNLTIRAYTGETPVFDNATQVTISDPVPDMLGVYRTTEIPANDDVNTFAFVWETDTPSFYSPVDDIDSVAAIAGSTFYDRTARLVYFHTSDGQSPSVHTIYSSHNAYNVAGLYVWRPNTTIDGLTFKNFVAGIAIANYAVGVTIRNCRFDYCQRAITTASWQGNASITVEYCEGINTAQGPYSEGTQGTVFRYNKFTKSRDRGMIPIDPQDDCGYQIYFTGVNGTIEYNFSKGYNLGVLVKTLPGTYVIRHNTFVFCNQGISSQVTLATGSVSYNVVALANSFQGIVWGNPLTYGNNLYWDVNKTAQAGQDSFLASGNPGTSNVFSDPRFFDPKNGDYRLLPSSPVPKEGSIPAGAFAYVSAAEAASAKPTIRLDLGGLMRPYRPEISSLDPDFWTNPAQSPSYLTASPDLPLRLATTPSLSFGAIGFPTTLHFVGWTTNPPASVSVANPSQQSTSVTATTDGTVTANWEQPN